MKKFFKKFFIWCRLNTEVFCVLFGGFTFYTFIDFYFGDEFPLWARVMYVSIILLLMSHSEVPYSWKTSDLDASEKE